MKKGGLNQVYKFKNASDEYDIPALLENKLWVSTLENMNDPMDLGFYIRGYRDKKAEIIEFQKKLNKSFIIISLGKTPDDRRLWNYYTDGMKGFALKYNNADLIRALKDRGAKKIENGPVRYTEEKTDLTDMFKTYIETGKIPSPKEATILFTKDKSWESEYEYRIIADADFLTNYEGAVEKGGICLENVIPTLIIIGYRMSEDKEMKIIEYAEKYNIEVRKYTPNFLSKGSKLYTKATIHKKEKTSKDKLDEEEADTSGIPSYAMMVVEDEAKMPSQEE